MRLWILTLLLANLVFAGFVYMNETRVQPAVPSTDLHVDKMHLVAYKATVGTVACVEWKGIAGADFQRAKNLLAPLVPANSIVESQIEEPTRFWVNIPPADNAAAMISRLRAAGVKEVSLQPDNAISLGLFSTEEAAQRHLEQIRSKGFSEAGVEPRSPHIKEGGLTVNGTSSEVVAKLGELKDRFAGSSVQLISCPAAEKKNPEASALSE